MKIKKYSLYLLLIIAICFIVSLFFNYVLLNKNLSLPIVDYNESYPIEYPNYSNEIEELNFKYEEIIKILEEKNGKKVEVTSNEDILENYIIGGGYQERTKSELLVYSTGKDCKSWGQANCSEGKTLDCPKNYNRLQIGYIEESSDYNSGYKKTFICVMLNK